MQREFANYDLCSPIIPLKTVGKFKSFSLLVMLQTDGKWLSIHYWVVVTLGGTIA